MNMAIMTIMITNIYYINIYKYFIIIVINTNLLKFFLKFY